MADGITLSHACIPLGGGVTEYWGAFVHTVGAAECTFKIGSARVYSVLVANMDSGGNPEDFHTALFTESVSGSTNTVTVHILETIADGRIIVKAKA